MRKPFFKKSHQRWYIRIDGKDVPLGEDEESAFRKWAAMVESGRQLGDPLMKVFVLASAFLNEQEGLISGDRLSLLTHYIAAFSRQFGQLLCSEVSKGSVVKWVSSQESWGDWARHDAIACAKRMFNWAVENDYMPKNPLKGLANPEPESRQRVLTPDEHATLIKLARESKHNGAAFALYLIASRCGARPQMIRSVESKHIVGQTWVLPHHKTRKKTGKPITIYMHPCLATICSMLRKMHPTGPLFRQDSGAAWTKDTAGRKFKRLREKAGISNDVVLYSYRHTFATESLVAGNTEAVVSKLLGHVDTKMISKTYGHLNQKESHLLDAAARTFKHQ